MKKILNTYKKAFEHVLIFGLLCLFCVIASFAIVFPFFYLASLYKGIYTVLCAFFIIGCSVFFVIKKIWSTYKTSPRRLFLFFFRLLVIALGIGLFVVFTLNLHKTFAIVSIVLFFALYVIFVPLVATWSQKE